MATDHSLISTDLLQEFAVINLNIPNLTMEEMNPIKRFCVVSVTTHVASCRLEITFPPLYPKDVSPNFHFLESNDGSDRKTAELSQEVKGKLLKSLQNTAHVQVKRNRPCLEPCLREFMSMLEKLSSVSSTPSVATTPSIPDYSILYGSFHDAHVPFPRTSGATFCSADLLVCFGRPAHLQQINAPTEFTPRALSALSAYLQTNFRAQTPSSTSNGSVVSVNAGLGLRASSVTELSNLSTPPPQVPSISAFYFNSKKKVRHRPLKKAPGLPGTTKISLPSPQSNFSYSTTTKCGPVYVFSVAGILPCSRALAETYVFSDNVTEMCQMNASAASAIGRKDLCQIWNLAELCAAPEVLYGSPQNNLIMDAPWSVHPAGRKLAQSLIDYHLNTCGDIQTAAMLCCAFSGKCSSCGKMNCLSKPCGKPQQTQSTSLSSPGSSPYHTVALPSPLQEAGMDEWSLVTAVETLKRNRSNSWSDPIEAALLTGMQSMPFQSPGQAYRIHCNEMALLRDQREAEKHEFNTRILDPKMTIHYDCIKQVYADILIKWMLLEKRVELLKYVSPNYNCQLDLEAKSIHSVAFSWKCDNCEHECQGTQCICNKSFLKCAVCRVTVKGAASFCIECGHGGHLDHMYGWFLDQKTCPTGCGCLCMENTSKTV